MLPTFARTVATLVAVCLCFGWLSAQQRVPTEWRQINDFHTLQSSFAQWKDQTNLKETKGWKSTARWLWFNEGRIPQNGNAADAARNAQAYLQHCLAHRQNRTASNGGNWDNVGVATPLEGQFSGRVNCVVAHPLDTNHVYIGTPDGGLWESYDGGQSLWSPLTDHLPALGVSAIAIDPLNPSIMYIGTGDADASGAGGLVSDSRSVGILKTTDAGTTWNVTGMTWDVTTPTKISRILLNSMNTSEMLAATSTGIQRSTDGGGSWTITQAGDFRDLVQDQVNLGTCYGATTTSVYKSTNFGASWSPVGAGLPTSNVGRIALALTSASTSYVYALLADAGGSNLGFYRSTDGGLNFTPMNTTENLVLWAGYYNLHLVADQSDPNKVWGGGVIMNRSTDGGTNWITNISGPGNFVDIHAVARIANALVACADQGIYYSYNNGVSWQHRNNYLDIFQYYRMGVGQTPNIYLSCGSQDVGGHFAAGPNWQQAVGGDGTGAAVDQTNPNTMYVASYDAVSRTTNGGFNWTSNINSGVSSEQSYWVFPIEAHPSMGGRLVIGYNNLFLSTNSGTSWSAISAFPNPAYNKTVVGIALCNDTQAMWFCRRDSIFRTSNGGATWQNVTGSLNVSGYQFYDIWVNPASNLEAFVAVSGYSVGNKVYRTDDGGATWQNISAGLPNISANCGVYAGNGEVYLGMDDGVYHYDSVSNTWTDYSQYLPNAIVTDIGIERISGMVYACTYGRGVWYSPTGLVSADPAQHSPQLHVSVSPNPTPGNWTLTYELGGNSRGEARLMSLDGKTLRQWDLEGNDGMLEMSRDNLANGLYLLQVRAGEATQILRVVLQ